ncbi:hypothetical protein AAFC00_002421 [Neodothiora populina]|uniref:1-phosphatidylinositol-3-phosphate 5-kinase n=1 Tax=Neodothiora populina TaxID=2781224 RepID=A0ABR3P712_9PEZI
MAHERRAPSASSTQPVPAFRSRRGSVSSLRSIVDKEALAQALDDIHTTASKSDALTSFRDFDGSATGGRASGPKEFVSGGISGLYSRLRQSVGASSPTSETSGRPASRASFGYPPDNASIKSSSSAVYKANLEDRARPIPAPPLATPSIPSPSMTPRTLPSQHVSRSSLNLSSTRPSSFSSQAPFQPSSLFDDADESGFTVLQRPVQKAHSRPASRDMHLNLALAKLQGSPSVTSPADIRDLPMSNRSSFQGAPFMRDESATIAPGDQSPRLASPMPSVESLQPPLKPIPSQISHTTSAPSRRQSQTPSQSEQFSINSKSALSSPVLVASDTRERPTLRVSASHLPNLRISQSSSTVPSASNSKANTPVATPVSEIPPNFNAGFQNRRPRSRLSQSQNGKTGFVPAHWRRRVLSKEFWMKDENARDCFRCGVAFSTFRRKHHCRTCGQIFDSQCTQLVPGKDFGQPGRLRLCLACRDMIYGSDDDSTVFSDEDRLISPQLQDDPSRTDIDEANVATPSIGIPVSKRNRDIKRRSAIIEFDQPMLARPSSSRSLKSLTGRPKSAGHKRRSSRQFTSRPLRFTPEERGPFYQDATVKGETPLAALNMDKFIDPDLADYMSDEYSEDDQQSIFTTLNGDIITESALEGNEKAGLSGLLSSAVKKGRSRRGDKSIAGQSLGRESEGVYFASRYPPKSSRKRNHSVSSFALGRPSPRRSRSTNVLKGLDYIVPGDDGTNSPLAFDSTPPTSRDAQIKCSSAMHGTNAPAIELNHASLQHVRKLLSQLLKGSKISHRKRWQKALMPILLQCTDDVDPDVQNGDDMDIRNYIKLKKIPGGKPGDTAYVSGVVFSKNIALKDMPRKLIKPRIVIITFPLEYTRQHSSLLSLENLIAQEREYVCMLVGRIVALKPQILLVQRQVCGLALQLLQEAGVTVVYNIKESVLAAVARVTQTVLIKSQDKLSIDPDQLGQCGTFEVKTYIYGGKKKTYIWMSGCQPDLGCTVVLRGADMETLRSIKRVTEFMTYVVYNLRLETCLMRDEFVLIPSSPAEVTAPKDLPEVEMQLPVDESEPVTPTPRAEIKNPLEAIVPLDQEHSIPDGFQVDANGLNHLVEATRHEVKRPATPEPEVHEDSEDENMPSQYRELIETARKRLISSSPFVKFTVPYLLLRAQEQERKVEQSRRLRDRYDSLIGTEDEANRVKVGSEFGLVTPSMLDQPSPESQPDTVRMFLRDMHDAQYQMALREYEIKKKQWESFFTSNGNDPFNPFNHQNIWVLHSIVSSVTSVPCAGPEVFGFGFYAGFNQSDEKLEEDCTLGQFVEDMCQAANNNCKVCNRKMLDHHRQYVHGHGQLSISVKRYPSKNPGLRSTIFMFSACKICQQETTWMPMSDSSWKYSFGKYLELSFWSTPLKPRASVCPHDIHKDFIRYFAFNGLAVRVQYDPVELYDVIVPRSTITWEVDEGLMMKNQLFTQFETKLHAFITSVKARLQSINLETVTPEKSADATAVVEKLLLRADSDREELLAKLQAKYMQSQFYEIVPMNRALRMMDEKAIAWDDAFADFERNYFPSENDIRRLATLQLKKIFLDRGEVVDQQSNDASDTEDGMEMQDRAPPSSMKLTDEHLRSEKTQDIMSSVVQENRYSELGGDEQKPASDSVAGEAPTEASEPLELARKLSPSEREQAADRGDVKHLDLAVPPSLPNENVSEPEAPATSAERKSSTDSKSSESFAVEPKPLNSTILERIEQMRSAANGAGGNEAMPESRIPRLAGLKSRGPPSPTLTRAQSQPSHVPRRSADLTGNMPSTAEASGSGEGSGSATPTQNDNVQNERLAKTIEQRLADRLGTGRKAQASLIPRSVPSRANENSTRVSALAKHFEQLSREFERERLRERRQRAARSRQVRANPLASSRPVVEVYTDPRLAVGEEKVDFDYDRIPLSGPDPSHEQSQQASDPVDDASTHDPQDEGDNTDHYATDTEMGDSTVGAHTDTEADGDATDVENMIPTPSRKRDRTGPLSTASSSSALSPSSPHEIDQHLDLTIPKHEKSSLMKMLTSFWSERSASGWMPLDYPLSPTEHVFDDSDIVVREDEPASVIALALSCADYVAKVDAFRLNPTPLKTGSSHSHTASQGSFSFPAQLSASSVASAQAAIEASLISPTGTHMKYSFAHGPVKTTCKIFYAESFDALRRKCGVSDRFVESLSRCAKWDSKGGKTKSLFLKTLDDRFVIKSLQEVELKAFTKFAPDYFSFMSHTLFHGVPSVIAKMFGLFQVIIKNPATGTEFSSYLLVMENLFYSRNPTRRFDLKGSMRNRKIESTGQPDEVLLDENLVETIFETPLFVREHARKLLRAGVWNDTMWLCKQNVMDYSLMAGFDDDKKELVVGIIDCIRTYTWDKKLESWIKDRGKNKPTITSPKDYRNRFRVSMMQYVLQAPNVWHGFLNQSPNVMPGAQGTDRTSMEHNAAAENLPRSSGDGARRTGGELAQVAGPFGRGFDGSEQPASSIKGKKEAERLVGEGHLMNEATIREMSTMTFA